jgi:RNA polymerase sigma factor (sigma-70 family)
MASQAGHLLTNYLHHLSSAARLEGLSDRELVERFAAGRDEDAFASLVRRHGPMVLRVCQRVLHDSHAAEDAFQATFLVFSRKAASLRCADTVGCWLHGVAFRLAHNARKQRAQRWMRENQAAIEKHADDPLAELSVREAQTILDDELARLPEKFRAPLVLCCLEGKSRDEAGRQLGWSSKLVKSRLEQGRERLHQRLTRRGLTLPAALGAMLLTEEAVTAALPAELVHAAVQATLPGKGVSASVALLAESALGGTAIGKAKVVIVGLLLLTGALVAGMGAFVPPNLPEKQAENPPAAKAKTPKSAKDEKPQPSRTFRVVVLDPQGKPLPDAKIHSGIWTYEKGFKANHDYQTDAAGIALVELPKSFYILRLWASKKGFADLFSGWEQNELGSGEKLPAEYVFRMERAVTAGGRIVDEQGKPIAGAAVEVRLREDAKPAHGDGRVSYNWSLTDRSNVTDADGRWRIDNVPDHPRVGLALIVSHPDYLSDNYGRSDVQKAAGITTEMLRKETATLRLKHGVIVRGQVTDPAGKPIKDAVVIYGDDPYSSWLPCKFPTDADGRYRLPALPPEQTTLTVIAPGWAPQLRRVLLRDGSPPQDFRMAAGKPIRLRIVDAAGHPIPNAFVHTLGWKGSKSLYWDHNPNHPKVPDTKIPRRAGADGVWQWDSAPDDPVNLGISAPGFASQEVKIAGGAAERTVLLKTDHRITGRVTDAATGKPIPSFTVIQLDVFRKDWLAAERLRATAGKNGRLDYLADRTDIPLRLRIEAPGYRTQDGPEFRVGDDSSRQQDFRLQPSEPISGVVCDAAGKPVAKAEVLLAMPTEEIRLQPGGRMNHATSTNSAGRFTFPDPGEPFVVVAQAEAGFALAECPAGQHDAGTLRLQPWASIRGRFRDGGQLVRNASIFVNLIRIDTLDRPRIHAGTGLQTTTEADGRFEFSRVPPLPVSVRVSLGPWRDEGFRSGPSVPLDLKPGQQAELDLGGGATIVKGKVKLTGKVPADLDCNYSLNYLVERAPGIDPPPEIARLGFDTKKGWRNAWTQTPEGLAYLSTLRHWFVKLAPDGSFHISGVPAGEYDLAIAVYAKPDG